MGRTIGRALRGVAVALGWLFMQAPETQAHHTLRKEITDILGPTAWGIYFILPIPFLVVGVIALLLYRSSRSARPRPGKPSSPTDARGSNSRQEPEYNPEPS